MAGLGRACLIEARPTPHDAGLTLGDLLLSLLLASMLGTGLFYMISGQTRAQRAELGNLGLQENLWSAVGYLQRSVRMAGFGMGRCPAGRILRYEPGGTLEFVPWLVPMRVYNGCSLLTSETDPPCSTIRPDSSDSLEISLVPDTQDPMVARLVRSAGQSPSISELVVAAPGAFFDASRPANMIVLWQPGSTKPCMLLTVTGPARAVLGGFALPYGGAVGAHLPEHQSIFSTGGYDAGALVLDVSNVVTRRIAVDDDPQRSKGIPRLVTWTAPDKHDLEVVADGIEDVQIAFACDDREPRNGVFEEGTGRMARLTDEWAHNVAGETDADHNGLPDPMVCSHGISAVRLTVTARGASPVATRVQGQRDGAEDRPAGPKDAYERRRLTVVVQPRNLRAAP